MNDEKQIKQLFLTLTQGLVTLADELRKVRVSLSSLEASLALHMEPANPKAALQYIREQDDNAQTQSPSPELEQVRLMLDSLKQNPTLGQA